ncbi:MAG: phage tail sheath family protein [Planctomycetaceae bacterium]
MPTQVSYPGVYIEEVPSGVRTITGVATSITAFLGRAVRGPVNNATTITSYADFERTFGGLKYEYLMSYTVRDFYQNGGSQAKIVRLFHPSFPTEAARQAARTSANSVATAAAASSKTAADNASTAVGATPATVQAAVAGAIPVAGSDAIAIAIATALSKAADDAAKATGATAATAAAAVSAMIPQVVSDAVNAAGPRTRALFQLTGLDVEACCEGAWGNELKIRVDHDVSSDVATQIGLTTADLFNLTIKDESPGGSTERFLNLSIKPSARNVFAVLKNQSNLIQAIGTPTAVPTSNAAVPAGTDPFSGKVASAYSIVSETASDGTGLNPDDYSGSQANKTGLYSLDDVDLFNLLCIPPDVRDQDTDAEVFRKARDYCYSRRAFLIVDPPVAWHDPSIGTMSPSLKSQPRQTLSELALGGSFARNAAIFFPRIRQADPQRGGQLHTFVPCGMIAGIMARTDATRGVWKAPAGLDASLNGIHSLSVKLTDAENGILNPVGINCLRSFPASGNVVWGGRTLDGDDQNGSEWKYIPVRRTALFIEETLYRGTQWVVFEPNDEPLWAQIRLNVGAFMHDLFRQGAFQGRSPSEAYFVKCDRETTTQNDINRGIVNVVVAFAPLKPAEFVVIKLTQIAGQIEA